MEGHRGEDRQQEPEGLRMNPPKMQFHLGDYHRDTGHLRAAEHGAYLLLMFHYWSTGALPDNDDQLSAIARMSRAEWKKHKPILQAFFKDGWKHGRIDYELDKARNISDAAREAGKASGRSRSVKPSLNDRSPPVEPTLEPLNHRKDSEADASGADAPPDPSEPERQLFSRGREILGRSAGGQIAKLLKAAGGNVPLARSKIELAATKDNAAEFIAKVITSAGAGPPAKPLTQHQIERQESREILNDLQKFIDDSSCGGGDADPGLLRLDPGDGQKSVHGGTGRDLVDLSARRGREGS